MFEKLPIQSTPFQSDRICSTSPEMAEPYQLAWRLKGGNFSVSEKFQAISYTRERITLGHFGTAKLPEKNDSVRGMNFATSLPTTELQVGRKITRTDMLLA
jgi:hypothetical protein